MILILPINIYKLIYYFIYNSTYNC